MKPIVHLNGNSNGSSRFLVKTNLNLLWEVLLDELHIDVQNKQLLTNIRTVFESNINPFTKNTNQNAQLVFLNKQFLSQVVIAVNRLFPNLKQEQDFKRIQISSEETHLSEPYKIEDIRETRQTDFEKQVNVKRADFENSINLNKPKELDFTDKINDDKITEMDTLIAETIARRKFDIEQIQHTSVSEEMEPQITNTNTNTNTDLSIYRKLKLRQPEQNRVISASTNISTSPNKKNVTWTDQLPNGTNNISLLIEEFKYPVKKEKIDILTDKADIIIDLLTKLLADKQLTNPL